MKQFNREDAPAHLKEKDEVVFGIEFSSKNSLEDIKAMLPDSEEKEKLVKAIEETLREFNQGFISSFLVAAVVYQGKSVYLLAFAKRMDKYAARVAKVLEMKFNGK